MAPVSTSAPKELDEHEKAEIGLNARASKFRATALEQLGVSHSLVDIYSDGTRMQGTVWRPKGFSPSQTYPCIVLCHGFGGKRAHLDYSYAPKFAQAGFIAITFDYRGWGDSDGILVAAEKQPKPDPHTGLFTIQARSVRKIVDPEWQLRDIDSALAFASSEPGVDINRIGLWGSSFGGGHALAIAGRNDPRVNAVVCQIGSINTHANWVNRHPQYRGAKAIRELSSLHARGSVFPWDISKPAGLDGMPNLPKTVFEHTKNTIESVRNILVPTMILAAQDEELFLNSKNSELVYDLIKTKVPAELDYLPGKHYDAYGGESYKKGLARAIDWFTIYLGQPKIPEAKL
ncbi:hypothetical protein BASA81_015194 [Batrachochytrium salamandrivorans]|nr:hypothetical protein BASA81_015194 [Batrachochytrium salamandrivorans]